MFTPADVHFRHIEQRLGARQAVMEAAFEAHPERFPPGRTVVGRPRDKVWINPPASAPEVAAPSATVGAAEVRPGPASTGNPFSSRDVEGLRGLPATCSTVLEIRLGNSRVGSIPTSGTPETSGLATIWGEKAQSLWRTATSRASRGRGGGPAPWWPFAAWPACKGPWNVPPTASPTVSRRCRAPASSGGSRGLASSAVMSTRLTPPKVAGQTGLARRKGPHACSVGRIVYHLQHGPL